MEPGLFRLLVASLCPAIFGHEMVKAGLVLCLFGGCSKGGEGKISTRGEPHMLVVGDPGLGKSQMLQACSNVAPRGIVWARIWLCLKYKYYITFLAYIGLWY